jgi:hypothetical protein
MTLIMLRVKVDTSILHLHVDFVNIHFLRLIMELIPLSEATGRGDNPQVDHRPNIFQ